MYIAASAALVLVGLVLLVLSIRRFRTSGKKATSVILAVVSSLFVLAGGVFLFLLLSGQLVLPVVQ